MRRSLLTAFLFFLSCIQLSLAGDKKRDEKPFFDHQKHAQIIDRLSKKCATCHPFKVDTEAKTIAPSDQFDSLLNQSFKELCHTCHQQTDPLRTQIYRCKTCHTDTTKVIPLDHRTDWLRKHGLMASSPMTCQECHTQTECVDCHRRFETIRPLVHPRNFRFFHSLEARMNPISCSSCHAVSQCVDCHKNGEPLR